MNRLIFIFAILTFLTSIPCTAGVDLQKTKIAVLDFQLQGEGYETADMGKIIAEWLITALVKKGRFEVIERRLLEKVLGEQKFVMTGVVDEKNATRIGNLLGATVLISGSVMKLQNMIEINARIIDVKSASIVAAESVKSDAAIKLEKLIGQMAEKIIKDFPLKGYIVEREGNIVSIDLGKLSGVKRDMSFDVFKEGKIITHPKTGLTIDVKKIKTGSIKISSVSDNTSEAVILNEKAPYTIEYGQMIKSAAKSSASKEELKGEWDVFSKRPSKSTYSIDKNNSVKWVYSVPKIKDDTYAGIGLFVNKPVSIKNRQLLIKIESKKGFPIYVRLYSFTKGFSKENDDQTFVPTEKLIGIKEGTQELLLETSNFNVPHWWRDESNAPDVIFTPEDVRVIEFEAEVDEDIGPVSDTIRINAVILQ